ncbi:probable membrane protein [Saccharopolyspora erythraea NRRL 2338]|uniref:Uncharacterized protein n=2 Tax=Saccharopolyspora erythraea TaxID=1836 RepID=A0ABP3N175_SACER|nr:hypothetical protein N599_07235 [Saccharopolyspora erythraea D]QRK93694.1 hypothetical protein JQX30_21160 [Saccharopolyspora erythraea]CAM03417.1 probable membrane protein [Saccharopolyspora erythraea NRRL 2338]
MVSLLFAFTAGTAQAAPAEEPQALLFATSNTAVITDPGDPRLDTPLTEFARAVRGIIRDNGARDGRSELLDGVFWSGELQRATYERSRSFDVRETDPVELHHIADLVRKEFGQESVLTFEHLPRDSARTDAFLVEVPGVDVTDLHDGLATDPQARERLGGGSVTMDGELVLVAELADLELAREFVVRLGGRWDGAGLRYGDREFVG